MQIISWFAFYFNYAYLIRLCDVTKPTLWPLPLQSIFKYSNANNFPIFQPILIKLVSKCTVCIALTYKIYLSLGLRSSIIIKLKGKNIWDGPLKLFTSQKLFTSLKIVGKLLMKLMLFVILKATENKGFLYPLHPPPHTHTQ